MNQKPIAYQLYSAREDAQKDLDSVLAQLKAFGYDGVEFAGFYGHSADEIRALLQKHRLKAISSHVPLKAIEEDMTGVLSFHRDIGCPFIAIPYLDDATRPGAAGFAHTLQVIYRFGVMAKEAGIGLLYHNHDFEFIQTSGITGLDFIYEALPKDLLQAELDTCWIQYAGYDPCAYIRKYANRCPVLHLKDYIGERKAGATPYALIELDEDEKKDVGAFAFKPLGYGCQNVESLVASGIQNGVQWFVVEQDESTDIPPLQAAKMSIDTLLNLNV